MLEDAGTAVPVHRHIHLAGLRRSVRPIAAEQRLIGQLLSPFRFLFFRELLKPNFVTDYLECIDQKSARTTEGIDYLLADLGVNRFDNELNDVARREILAK